jgi:hypothetical protein
MNQEHDDFARQHPSLDRALRDGITAPKMDGAFRQQVFARIAAQRRELARAAASPDAARSRLRAHLLLQLANIGAVGLAAALLIGALWPRLAGLPAAAGLAQEWGLPVAVALAGAALFHGLRRLPLPGWVRGLGN